MYKPQEDKRRFDHLSQQQIKSAVSRSQCLLGLIPSQWGCSEEGKQRLSQGICHLTWLLCSVCCSLEKKSKTVATPEALFQKHLSFTLKLRCAPARTGWCFTEESVLCCPARVESLVQTAPKSYESTNGRGRPWRCEIVLTENHPNQ